jgi:chromosome segregation ATPase
MNTADLQAYQQKNRTRLKELQSRLDILEKRTSRAEADIQVRYDQKLDQLRGQYAQAKGKLEDLESARHETWKDEKTELDRAIDTLSESIDYLARRISV